MALNKMQSLAAFFLSKNLFAAEQFDYWMENGTAEYAAKRVGQGVVLCRFRYDAVLSVERYSQSADLFLALLSAWLLDNDADREGDDLPMPDVDVTPLNDRMADIEITVNFIEDITLVPDPEGAIAFSGEQWRLSDVSLNTADQVGVGDDDEEPTDLPYSNA